MDFFSQTNQKKIIGMVHLAALPGSPGFSGSFNTLEQEALTDAEALTAGGVDAIMIENFGDVPFFKYDNEPHTIAFMTRLALKIKAKSGLPIGINVLRNDIRAALGIAAAVEADFVRVNVHTGAMITDQGIIEGAAADTLRYRQQLGINMPILADISVKHATQLGSFTLEEMAKDTAYRGLADGLIVSGSGTGQPTDPETIRRVKTAVPDRPILVGSGLSLATIDDILPLIDGAIVGTAFKQDGASTNPVDQGRVVEFMERCRG